MKTKLYIIELLSVVTTVANAQSFSTNRDQRVMPNQQVVGSAVYTGTVYEPFSSTTPSEQSYTPAQIPGSGPRRNPIVTDDDEEGWTDKPDTGGTNLSPIGDAVLPMLLCAAVFCGVIALRRRRSALNR